MMEIAEQPHAFLWAWRARRAWGDYAQLDMVIEECSELIKAIQKFKRSSDSLEARQALLEESVDVAIVLDQLKEICGFGAAEAKLVRLRKIARLNDLLDEAESNIEEGD